MIFVSEWANWKYIHKVCLDSVKSLLYKKENSFHKSVLLEQIVLAWAQNKHEHIWKGFLSIHCDFWHLIKVWSYKETQNGNTLKIYSSIHNNKFDENK